MSIKTEILDLLFPPKCAFCGKLMEKSGTGICPDCEKTLPAVKDEKVLRTVQGFPCVVCFYYEDMVRAGIHALKFQGKSNRAEVFGRLLAQAAAEHLSGEFDAITYVPVHFLRNYRRGYDQARLLAQAAAAVWGVPVERTVRKIRSTRPQSTLDRPEQRRANALGVYAAIRPERIAGRRFLLVDDVLTTGSTMSSCAQTLLAAGAKSVVCAALAGGRQKKGEDPSGLR